MQAARFGQVSYKFQGIEGRRSGQGVGTQPNPTQPKITQPWDLTRHDGLCDAKTPIEETPQITQDRSPHPRGAISGRLGCDTGHKG
eukprot:COSAG02_NODE_137_length_34526_cov_94.448079_12_plen_86_part_00